MKHLTTVLLLGAALSAAAAPSRGAGYEPLPVLDPDAVLGKRARGANYEVLAPITTDGFLLAYRIHSSYGEFQVEGRPLLEMRLREVDALAALSELSKTEVFTDAVKQGLSNATIGQVEAVEAFAERPVETLKGVPKGVSKMFKKVKGQTKEAVDSVQGSKEEGDTKATAGEAAEASKKYALKYLGVTGAQRKWAQKLGVDPYTSNEILRKQIAAVAKIDAAGRFGVKLLPIPRIPGVSLVRGVTALVWETDPYELRARNRALLEATGVTKEVLDVYFDNEFLSPTVQTAIVASIERLAGVAGLAHVIEEASRIDSEAGAWFYAQSLHLLANNHEDRRPLQRMLGGFAAPVAEAKGGQIVVGAAVERLYWTAELDEAIAGLLSATPDASGRELLIGGTLTDVTKRELASRKVKVLEGLAGSLEEQRSSPAP